MGQPRHDVDKQGDACTTYDCVLSEEVLRQSQAYRPLKVFLIELALNWVGQKYGTPLDPKFKLPKMRYKGGQVEAQRIRVDRKPLVTELRDVPEAPVFPLRAAGRPAISAGKAAAAAAAAAAAGGAAAGGAGGAAAAPAAGPGSAAQAPAALQASVTYEGRPVSHVVVTAQLPQAAASGRQARGKEPQVSVSGRQLLLEAPGCRALQLELAFFVDAARAEAQLSPSGELRLRLPHRTPAAAVEELRRCSPHALGSLQLASQGFLELEA
jgi:hypothetical protein